jgi:integrase
MKIKNTSILGNETIDPVDQTPTSAPARPPGRGRTGKIARLPYTVRRELNRRMRDGERGPSLIKWLHSLPDVQAIIATQFEGRGIQKQNLSQWRRGGYRDFLKHEETRQELRSFLEEIKGLQEAAPDGVTDQLALYLAVQIGLELKQLKAAPDGAEKAKRWRELSANLVALRRGDIQRDRVRLQQEKLGLAKQTEEERKAAFWKWAEENINRDEFCRRRCYTAAERQAAINKILGITPLERGEIVPEKPTPRHVDPSMTQGCQGCDQVNPCQS